MADQEQDELVTVLGIEIDKQKFKSSLKSIQDFGTNVKSLKTGMSLLNPELSAMERALGAIGIAGAAFIAGDLFAGKEAKNISQLKEQADVLGITANQLQTLQLAAKNSNIDVAQVTGVIGSLREQLLGFQTGNPPTKLMESLAKASSLLGVSISPIEKNGKIKSAYELFTQVADAIGKIHDKTKQAAVSQLIFGQNLTPLLSHGMQGINQAYKELDSHGLFIKPGDIEQMKAFNLQMNLIGAQFDNMKMKLAEGLIPNVGMLNKKLLDIANNKQFVHSIGDIINAVGMLAGWLAKVIVLFDKYFNFVAKVDGAVVVGLEKLTGNFVPKNSTQAQLTSYAKDRLAQVNNNTNNNSNRSTTNIHIGQSPRSFTPAHAFFGSNR